MDDRSRAHPDAEFIRSDLRVFENCHRVCEDMDFVFNLLGVKGSPAVTVKYPETFYYNIVILNTQLMEAARQRDIKEFLYTSTNGVYAPASVMYEDDMWKNPPSPNDKFAGWAKRMGELQAEACEIESGMIVTVVRPANIYGPYDNFDSVNAMVVPSLIKKAVLASEQGTPMTVWGDGASERDFVHARDVALGMILAAKYGASGIYNIGSGTATAIRQLAETIVKHLPSKVEIVWDTSKPSGDRKRFLDIRRICGIGYRPEVMLDQGINETIQWYLENRSITDNRFDVFNK